MAVLWPLSRQRARAQCARCRRGGLSRPIWRSSSAIRRRHAAGGAGRRSGPHRGGAPHPGGPMPWPPLRSRGARQRHPAPAMGGLSPALLFVPLLGASLYAVLGSPALPAPPWPSGSRRRRTPTTSPFWCGGWRSIWPPIPMTGRAMRFWRRSMPAWAAWTMRRAPIAGDPHPRTQRRARGGAGRSAHAAADGHGDPGGARAFTAAVTLDPRSVKSRYFPWPRRRAGRTPQPTRSPSGANCSRTPRRRPLAADAGSGPDPPRRHPARRHPPPAATSPRIAPATPQAPGPSAQDVAAAPSRRREQRSAMIMGMVSRLEERLAGDPKDLDGGCVWPALECSGRQGQGQWGAAIGSDHVRRR